MTSVPNIETPDGSVAGLWRYPVKSMMGEELTATQVTTQLRGRDRQR